MKMFYKSLSFRMFYNYFEYFKESLSSCTQLKCLLRHCLLVFVPLGFSVTIDICLPGQYLYRHSHPVQCTVYSICIVTVTLYSVQYLYCQSPCTVYTVQYRYLYRHSHPVQCTVSVPPQSPCTVYSICVFLYRNYLYRLCQCIFL